MNLNEYFDRRCLRYMRATVQPGLQPPIPSAWVIAVADHTVYWLDLALRADGLSRWHLATRYPNTTLVDPCFRPLTKLRKITWEQKENYWRVQAQKRAEWRARSAKLSMGIEIIPSFWHRWFPPVPARDVILRSEYSHKHLGGYGCARYLREATVKVQVPNKIDSHFFRDGRRQVVSFMLVDAALQALHLSDVWQRLWFLDHKSPNGGVYVDGLSSGYVGDVVRPNPHPGCESLPFSGEPDPIDSITFSQWRGYSEEFLRNYK